MNVCCFNKTFFIFNPFLPNRGFATNSSL